MGKNAKENSRFEIVKFEIRDYKIRDLRFEIRSEPNLEFQISNKLISKIHQYTQKLYLTDFSRDNAIFMYITIKQNLIPFNS